MNKENLLKLADYLDTLPENYQHFEMSDFMEGGDPTKYALYATKNGSVAVTTCGAVACAVGHGPSAGFLFNKDELIEVGGWVDDDTWMDDLIKPRWHDYTRRVFGVDTLTRKGATAFDFMFGAHWCNYDNTPQGAAARIRYCVEHGPLLFGDFIDEHLYPLKAMILVYAKYRK